MWQTYWTAGFKSGILISGILHMFHSTRIIMVIVVGSGYGDTSSNPRRGCLISQMANTFWKSMNPAIPSIAMSK